MPEIEIEKVSKKFILPTEDYKDLVMYMIKNDIHNGDGKISADIIGKAISKLLEESK